MYSSAAYSSKSARARPREPLRVPHHGRVVRERLPVGGGRGRLPRGGRARRQDRRPGRPPARRGARAAGGRGSSRSRSTATAARLSSIRRISGRLRSTARRASSCRKAMAPSTTVTMPRRSGSASASNPPSSAVASSRSSGRHHGELFERPLCGGVELVQPRQHGVHDGGGHLRVRRREHLGDEERVAARARQHGLDGLAPERGDPRGREAGERDPGARPPWRGRRAAPAGDAPARTSSGRQVSTTSACTRSNRRVSWRSASRVASSAQCTSSISRNVGCSPARQASSASSRSSREPSASAARSAGGPSRATSRRGPRGRGVSRSSQPPLSTTQWGGRSAANARTSAVFPIPASPVTSATAPAPGPTRPAAPRRTSSCAERSTSVVTICMVAHRI